MRNSNRYFSVDFDIHGNTNIYTYQQDNEKQISFLTGNNYQISDKLLSSDKKKINIINALAIVYKAVQELNEKIEGGKN